MSNLGWNFSAGNHNPPVLFFLINCPNLTLHISKQSERLFTIFDFLWNKNSSISIIHVPFVKAWVNYSTLHLYPECTNPELHLSWHIHFPNSIIPNVICIVNPLNRGRSGMHPLGVGGPWHCRIWDWHIWEIDTIGISAFGEHAFTMKTENWIIENNRMRIE